MRMLSMRVKKMRDCRLKFIKSEKLRISMVVRLRRNL